MKSKYFLLLLALGMVSVPMAAQETYQDTKLMENELNGTARYVGMGGAMEALGADISTMQSNPAGIGLFRKSQFAISGGLVSQSGDNSKKNWGVDFKGDATNASFDQAGFVWASRTGRNSWLNVGFNFHKSRNFDQILSTANKLTNASLNKFSAAKYAQGLNQKDSWAWNGVDDAYAHFLVNDQNAMNYYNATSFMFGQYQKGYIGEYDFNISGNINNRVFLGATFGIHDVNYRSNKIYTENDASGALDDNYEMLKIDGTGFDIKFGAIFRPIEDSPFRIGVYVNTPVFYDLTMRNAYDLTWYPASTDKTYNPDKGNAADYDFKVYTPWKFGVSLGHTIGDYLAMGLTYEYQKYGAIDNRVNDGDSYYDYWTDSYYSDSNSDDAMNNDTELNLKSVHLLKVGVEYKPIQNFAIRLGYNYMSPQFNTNAYRDGSIQSPGVAYATSADYTNWKATNRFTFGLGYTYGNFFADAAYQYSQTNGDFYPFMSYYDNKSSDYNNIADATKVSFDRHQLIFTVGYKF
jgi:hypothetical protein